MQAQIRLGRVFGIEIGLHYSWLIVALLIVLSLSGQFRSTNPGWSEAVIWASSVVTALLFFSAIVIHELSHSVVARIHGLTVRSIVLFALGGVSQIEKDSPNARTEFWIAIAGPIASVVIGVVCLAAAALLGWSPAVDPHDPTTAVLVWLGYINLLLAAFNMLPGFPLDGGRVLRGAIWWFTGSRTRATLLASRIGEFVSYAFIVTGLIRFFSGAGLGGLWISFIGWLLLDASRATQVQEGMTEALKGIQAGDVLSRDYDTIDSRSNIQTFVEDHLLKSGRRCFIAVRDGNIEGLITPQELQHVPRAQWPYKTVDDVMRPLDQLRTVTIDTPIIKVLEMMGRDGVNQLPVMSNGVLEGMVSRSHILQLIQTKAELSR